MEVATQASRFQTACPPNRADRPLVFTNDQLTAQDYHAEREHVSSSQLVQILQSPGHFKRNMETGSPDESDLMRLGASAHCALLEPNAFPQRYVFAPRSYDRRRTLDKEESDAIRAANPGRTLLSPAESLTLHRIVGGINAHATAKKLLSAPGQPELSIFWRDDVTGLLLKARIDRYVNVGSTGTMLEVKTSNKAGDHPFGYKIVDMAYEVRAVMYADGIQKAYGFTPDIVWLVIEPETGFVATYRPTARMLARGRRLYLQARNALAQAMRTNHWPAYQDGQRVEPIDLPRRARF